jgi:hypothetical protein
VTLVIVHVCGVRVLLHRRTAGSFFLSCFTVVLLLFFFLSCRLSCGCRTCPCLASPSSCIFSRSLSLLPCPSPSESYGLYFSSVSCFTPIVQPLVLIRSSARLQPSPRSCGAVRGLSPLGVRAALAPSQFFRSEKAARLAELPAKFGLVRPGATCVFLPLTLSLSLAGCLSVFQPLSLCLILSLSLSLSTILSCALTAAVSSPLCRCVDMHAGRHNGQAPRCPARA